MVVRFDLIINTTSKRHTGRNRHSGVAVPFPLCCYDMFYQKGIRHFSLVKSVQRGAKRLRRWAEICCGGRAAHAVLLWRGITAGRASD